MFGSATSITRSLLLVDFKTYLKKTKQGTSKAASEIGTSIQSSITKPQLFFEIRVMKKMPKD